MGLNPSTFAASVRQHMGNPTQAEFEDAALSEAIRFALKDYSREKPKDRADIPIWLVSGLEEYTLNPEPDMVFDVALSAPTTASARAFGQEFRAVDMDLYDIPLTDLVAGHFYRVSQYRELFEQIEWNYDNPPVFFISPPPIQAQQAMLLTGSFHVSVATVPAHAEETLLFGVLWKAFDMWANKRDSLSVMQIPSGIGSAELVDGKILRERGKEYRTLFEGRLGWQRPTIAQG